MYINNQEYLFGPCKYRKSDYGHEQTNRNKRINEQCATLTITLSLSLYQCGRLITATGVVIVTVLGFLRGLRCLCLIDCGVTLYCSSSTSVLLIYCLSVCFGAPFSHLFHAPCLSRCKGRAAIPLFKAILYYGSGNSRG